jgi:MerR family transcriptional regulator, mercuric resistance operon regulatory protein
MGAITNAREGGFTIGTLARQTNCNVETIRYYERAGLLPAPPRTEGGHRVYGAPHTQRLRFIRRGRELGFTLDQIRELLGLAKAEPSSCAEIQAIVLAHLDNVRQKIIDLGNLESSLRDLASQCEGGNVPQCPVIETLFGEP